MSRFELPALSIIYEFGDSILRWSCVVAHHFFDVTFPIASWSWPVEIKLYRMKLCRVRCPVIFMAMAAFRLEVIQACRAERHNPGW